MIDSKLHFNFHIDYIYPDAFAGLSRFITNNYSSVNARKVLHSTLIRPQLAYVSVAKNNFTSADTNEL
jgi:hypothetical protein